jgi:succinate-semialdehyde dehydrogenase/glutarate-semialdehyde dehydrogenase
MKKGTFELGGNDPFLVLKDAEIDKAVDCAYKSRMLANAQSCINAKRFFIQDEIFDEFTAKLISKIKTETLIGDPLDPKINLGPLALQKQVTLLKD